MNYHFSQEKKCNKKLLVFILIDGDNVQFKKVFEKRREEKRVPKKKKKRELKYPLCKKITPRRIILTIEVKIPLLDLIPLQTYRILQGIAYIHHDSIIRSLKKDPRCLETAKAPLEGALSLSLKVESRCNRLYISSQWYRKVLDAKFPSYKITLACTMRSMLSPTVWCVLSWTYSNEILRSATILTANNAPIPLRFAPSNEFYSTTIPFHE